MRTILRTLPVLLPTLALPALLLAPGSADAAQLSISSGFRSAAATTETGWDFTVHAEATVEASGQSAPTTIDLSCSVDETAETVECDGEMTIASTTVDIRMDAGTDYVGWAIESGASTLFNDIHEQWSDEVVTRTVAPGWSAMQLFFGGAWRWWYYMSDTPGIFEGITGMHWEEVYVWEA